MRSVFTWRSAPVSLYQTNQNLLRVKCIQNLPEFLFLKTNTQLNFKFKKNWKLLRTVNKYNDCWKVISSTHLPKFEQIIKHPLFCEGRWLLCWFTYSLVGRQMTAKTYTNRYIMSSMFCEKCKNNEIVTLRKKFRLLMWLQTKIWGHSRYKGFPRNVSSSWLCLVWTWCFRL